MPHTERMDEQEIEVRPRPFGTWALIAVNIAVYVMMSEAGVNWALADVDTLIEWGAADAVAIWAGEIWRLGTAMFVHGAFWHLALNLWVLFQVGPILETVLGTSRYLLVYLSSGLFGFACSLLMAPTISVGASGAIFGVVGGLFALILVARDDPTSKLLLRALTPFVIATFVIGFLLPFVDNGAHVGGLIAGFLCSYGFLADDPKARLTAEDPNASARSRSALAALMLYGVLFVVLLPLSLAPVYSPRYEVAMGWNALAHGKLDEAKAAAQRAAKLGPKDAAVLILQGRLALPEDRAKGLRLIGEGLSALSPKPATALALAQARERVDPKTITALCDVTLERIDDDTGHEVLNNCAWHLLTAADVRERDPARALQLALRARDAIVQKEGPDKGKPKVSNDVVAAYWHTLATAYDKVGEPQEAADIMERLIAQGYAEGFLVPTAWYKKERNRFRDRAALAARKKKAVAKKRAAATKKVPAPLPPAVAGDGGPADASSSTALDAGPAAQTSTAADGGVGQAE